MEEEPPLQNPEKFLVLWIISALVVLIGTALFLYFAKVPKEEVELKYCFLESQNPYETDFEGNTWDEGDGWFSNIDAIAEYAKNEGYDGVIARNIRGNEEDKPRTDYVVFDLKHVKTNENI